MGPTASAFWKDLNYRREALGALDAQILLCVDPWHYGLLVNQALDLLSWIMPKFHLIPPADLAPIRSDMLTGNIALAKIEITPAAAHARWETFWPIVEKKRRTGRYHLQPSVDTSCHCWKAPSLLET